MQSINEAHSKRLSELSSSERYGYRLQVYLDTKKLVNSGVLQSSFASSISDFSLNEKILAVHDLPPTEKKETLVSIVDSDCIDVAIQMKKKGFNPVVLNMANNFRPGGGVEEGAGAQEESIFRRSNYFQHLSPSFYPIDGAIYSGNVAVFKDCEAKGYTLLESPQLISFIACAALRHPNIIENEGRFEFSLEDYETTRRRIQIIVFTALKFGHDCLVLSAFGCGAYRNPSERIAEMFKEVLESQEFQGRLERVVFAIFNDHNARHVYSPEGNVAPFAKVFQKEVLYDVESLA